MIDKKTVAMCVGFLGIMFCFFYGMSKLEDDRKALFETEIPLECYSELHLKLNLLKEVQADSEFRFNMKNAISKKGYIDFNTYEKNMNERCAFLSTVTEENILYKPYLKIKENFINSIK